MSLEEAARAIFLMFESRNAYTSWLVHSAALNSDEHRIDDESTKYFK